MAKHLVESEFEVIPSDGAVEVIFIPTSSHYTFSRLSNRRDIAEFSLLSPDPRIRHAGQSRSSNYTAPEVRYMAFRLASEAARRGWSGWRQWDNDTPPLSAALDRYRRSNGWTLSMPIDGANWGQPGLLSTKREGRPHVSDHEKLALGPFLCSIRKPFLRPDLALSSPPRADAVKVGRRASRAANSDFARPHLDGGEHGGTLAPCRGIEADLERLFAAARLRPDITRSFLALAIYAKTAPPSNEYLPGRGSGGEVNLSGRDNTAAGQYDPATVPT
jgi:hypothetical protein